MKINKLIFFILSVAICISVLNLLSNKSEVEIITTDEINKYKEEQNINITNKSEEIIKKNRNIERSSEQKKLKKKKKDSEKKILLKDNSLKLQKKNEIVISDKSNNPLETINQLHEGLKVGLAINYNDTNKIMKLIKTTYDIEKMISMIVGNSWKNIEEDKRKKINIVFEEYVAKNYIKRFRKLRALDFKILEKKKVAEKYFMVKSKLIFNESEKINIDYLLVFKKNRWKIFDVLLAESISEIATKKSEFSSFVKNGKIDSLIQALEVKNSKLIN